MIFSQKCEKCGVCKIILLVVDTTKWKLYVCSRCYVEMTR